MSKDQVSGRLQLLMVACFGSRLDSRLFGGWCCSGIPGAVFSFGVHFCPVLVEEEVISDRDKMCSQKEMKALSVISPIEPECHGCIRQREISQWPVTDWLLLASCQPGAASEGGPAVVSS